MAVYTVDELASKLREIKDELIFCQTAADTAASRMSARPSNAVAAHSRMPKLPWPC